MGKKVGINRIIKSGDARLMFDEAYKYYKKEKRDSWTKAYQLFDAVQHYFTGTQTEDSVMFFRARCKFKERDYEAATTLLDEYRHKYGGGNSPFIEDAEGMHALCYYYMSPEPRHDQTITSQAIITITEFMSRYPQSTRLEDFRNIITELTQRLHDKAFINAYTYYKIGRHKSAIVAFRNALKTYPESSHREELMYYIVKSGYELAHNSIESKQTDRYMKMLDSYYSFIAEFPESKYVKELGRLAKTAKDYMEKNNKENL
ncbi:MAG: outer membrane protein assembly factor BamD [Alistipes sp.]|nr:outer membrane protein assembly factor BamD [Alistipes sp.]MBQ3246632.1 outer membrane protein assembly factor BamD [Alistipes sp.]